jgi:diacylglycerol kinase family enzyme
MPPGTGSYPASYQGIGTLGRVRALLIANPKATSASRRVRGILVRAFAGDLDLEIAETAHRGHATDLARQAAEKRHDVVLTLGGDGTVNEVVNGLMMAGSAADVPALAVLPGGSANVFARSLGLPNDAIGALTPVLDALRAGRYRTVGLGQADERYFTFCAGLGLDAEVIKAVEERRDSGSRANPGLYVLTALRQFISRTDRRRPALTLERPGLPPLRGLFLAIVSNTSPWTYLGPRPVNPNPEADINLGLDVFGLRRLGVTGTLGAVGQMMLPLSRPVRGRHVVSVHDAAEATIRSRRPIAFQLDGDYLGEREAITLRAIPKAVRIVI